MSEKIRYYIGEGIGNGENIMVFGETTMPDYTFHSLPKIINAKDTYDITGLPNNAFLNVVLVTFKDLDGGPGKVKARFRLYRSADSEILYDSGKIEEYTNAGEGSWVYFWDYSVVREFKNIPGEYYWEIWTSDAEEEKLYFDIIGTFEDPDPDEIPDTENNVNMLHIITIPDGAEIYTDTSNNEVEIMSYRGLSPKNVNIYNGMRRVIAKKEGYYDWEQIVELKNGEWGDYLNINLEPIDSNGNQQQSGIIILPIVLGSIALLAGIVKVIKKKK